MANTLNKVNSGGIEDGSIVNADIKSDAAIAGSKLADNAVGLAQMAGIARGKLIVGDSSGDPAYLAAGSNDQILTMDANGDVGWEDPAASGAALTGSTDNTVVTVTGSNAMQGEANLKFDGNNLTQTIDADGEGIILDAAGNHKAVITGNTNRTTTGNTIFMLNGKWDDTEVARISVEAGADTTDKDDGILHFYTRASGGSLLSTLKLDQSRNVTITDGDLVIGTAGHGIDFSAASDSASGETVSSSLLDDYEEGTFTSSIVSSNMTLDDSSATGHYVKIGRVVHACGILSLNTNDGSPAVSGSDNITQSLPFQPRSTNAAMTGTIFQQNINAGPGTSVGHPHYYNIFPIDYLCYPASDGVRFYINKIEYSYERMTNSHMSAGFPGYTWMSWSITYQTSQ